MLTSLDISNYRGFRQYRLGSLSRVNLLVGKNNSGKTALLEAVHLLAAGGSPWVIAAAAGRRGELVRRRDPDISHLFHGHEIAVGSQIRLAPGNAWGELTMRIVSLDNGRVPARLDGLVDQQDAAAFGMAIEGGRLPGLGEAPLVVTSKGALLLDTAARAALIASQGKPPAQFISPSSLELRSLAEWWNQVILESREQQVIEAMRILEPEIASVVFLTGEYAAAAGDGGGVVVSFQGDPRRVPLGSLGDGMRRLLSLSVAMVRTQGGILLVDEIDAGFHYSVMADMWRLVVETAIKSNIQVFATTHSFDCVRGLAALCEREPSLQPQVALHKIERNLPASVPFSGHQVALAVRQEIEVR